jgi:hypothetical protein
MDYYECRLHLEERDGKAVLCLWISSHARLCSQVKCGQLIWPDLNKAFRFFVLRNSFAR